MCDVSTTAHRVRYTYADYLALEASSNVKHEFLDGQIYAMAGGTPEHAALGAAVIGLFPLLRGSGCRAYDADLRVRTPSGLATYPDVTVVCGPAERHRDDEQSVTNPKVIVEVLSPSTEEYDRGDKFEHYKSLPSLQQYVLVSHRERSIEVWTREHDSDWVSTITREGGIALIASIDARLDVRDVYEASVDPAH
jgi:Uma2 family endonuclease